MVRRAWWFKALVGCVAVGACGDDVPGPGGDPPDASETEPLGDLASPRIPAQVALTWPPTPAAAPLDLAAVRFDPSAGDALRGCLPIQREANPPILHVAPVDLDADGVYEVVLGNQRCPDGQGGWVDDPVARWDPSSERLVIGEPFVTHLSDVPNGFGPSMVFLDVDADGDADLVGSIPDPDDRGRLRPVWWNDGAGHFEAAPLGPSLDGLVLAAVWALGVVLDGDGRLHLWMASRDSAASPEAPMAPTDVVVDDGGLQVVPHRSAAVAGLASAWSWVAVSLAPTERPFEHLFPTVNPIGVSEDFHWRIADALWEPDDFVDAARGSRGEPVDAVHFATPACPTASATCYTPMGGSMIRFPDLDDAGAPTWRDCAAISTGSGPWPVFVGCPVEGRLIERGELVAAFAGADVTDVRLAWQVSGTWDVNADGFSDILVTNGRDAGPFPAQPSYAYLRRPGCFDASCGRFERVDLPLAWGHHHGFALVPMPRADGGWTWLGLLNSNAVDPAADARVAAFTWQPVAADAWVSLALGPLHDLRAMGAVVTPRFVDEQGATVVAGEPTLVALASTRGHPGVQQPLVWGLPSGAVSAVAHVAPVRGGTPFEVTLLAGVPTLVQP